MTVVDKLKSFFKKKPIGAKNTAGANVEEVLEKHTLQHYGCGGGVGNALPHFKSNGDYCCDWLSCVKCNAVFHGCIAEEMESVMDMFG